MKKYILFLVAVMLPSATHAANISNVEGLVGNVGRILDLVVPIVITLAVIYFFYGLAQYILKSGDEGAKEEGRNVMIYGTIALFVMLSIWGIIGLVGNSIGITETGGVVNIPKIIK